MAESALTLQEVNRSALVIPTYGAANVDGNYVTNDGFTLLHFYNSGTDIVVTIVSQETVDGKAVASRTYTITNAAKGCIVPFQLPTLVNDASHFMHFAYSPNATGLTVAPLHCT